MTRAPRLTIVTRLTRLNRRTRMARLTSACSTAGHSRLYIVIKMDRMITTPGLTWRTRHARPYRLTTMSRLGS